MLSLSGCKCQRDASPERSGIMPDAQCRSAHNNGNERRNTAYANARTSLRVVRRVAGSLGLKVKFIASGGEPSYFPNYLFFYYIFITLLLLLLYFLSLFCFSFIIKYYHICIIYIR